MLMKKIFNKTCTNCQSHKILFDEYKGELFCNDCGLILTNIYEPLKITDYIKQTNEKSKEKQNKNIMQGLGGAYKIFLK